jgi:hypothetical protein
MVLTRRRPAQVTSPQRFPSAGAAGVHYAFTLSPPS